MKVKASCLCEEIQFEVELITDKIFNCHCSRCRKSHGSAFATQAFAKGETLRFLKGESQLGEFKGGLGIRSFCKNCGSRLMNYASDKSLYTSIALACIDTPTKLAPKANCFTDDKASWSELSSELQCYPAYPEL